MSALQHGHHAEGIGMNSKLNTEQDWRELARQAEWSVATLATLCGRADASKFLWLEQQEAVTGKGDPNWH